ncbi:MAG: glycosyltransferase family 4 protein [Chloroflexota bacterium]
MRLLYLGSTDVPQPKARAIQIVNTCHALARLGADVTLVAGRRGRAATSEVLASFGLAPHPRLRVIRVPIARIPPTAPPRILRQFTRLWQASYLAGLAAIMPREVLLHRPDVIFTRDFRTAQMASGPARAIGARVAFEVHGLPSYEVEHRAGRATLDASEAERLRLLEQRVFDAVDRVITITDAARALIAEMYRIDSSRLATVPDATSVGPAERVQSPAASDDSPTRNVYYVGQLYPWKGAEIAVQAAALAPDARLVVVGGMPDDSGPDSDRAALVNLVDRLGVGERVEFRGYVPYARVSAELARADIALLPLPDEPVARIFTSPLKLFDYMAAGVAIVSSDLPSLREVLRHEENALLVPAGDAAAMAAAIQRLAGDPVLARRLGAQARRDVETYTWDRRARRIAEVLGFTEGRLAEVVAGG